MSILKKLKTPVFYVEGAPEIDVEKYTLAVEGLVEKKRVFQLSDIMKLKKTVADTRLTSVSGWSVRAEWGGVLFSDFLREIELKPAADHVIFSAVGDYTTCVALADLVQPNVLVCWEVGGAPLDRDYGGPLRMVIPHLWGYKSCKSLASMTFTDRMYGGYWEDRGYPRNAPIEPGQTFDINTRQQRPIGGGEVTEF